MRIMARMVSATATLLIATSSVALSAIFHLSHVLAPDDPVNVAALRFADVVKEKTQGRVEIKVHPASSLSGLKDGVEGVRLGTVDISLPEVAQRRSVPETVSSIYPSCLRAGSTPTRSTRTTWRSGTARRFAGG